MRAQYYQTLSTKPYKYSFQDIIYYHKKRYMKRKLSFLWRPELFEIQTKMDMPKYKDKSKDFVIEKIASLIPDRISEGELSSLISSILFERD